MLEERIITLRELSNFGSVSGLNDQVIALVRQQQKTWEVAQKNYAMLLNAQTKTFHFGHFEIKVQHNPERIRSSAAKTDAKSIAGRACFLCLENLPAEQKGIMFRNKYLILTNPYPIFPFHLTISMLKHTPQRIGVFFPDMLDLSRQLTGFSLLYNGPQSGASAPDHFHFQAGNKGFLPVETEAKILENRNETNVFFQNEKTTIVAAENYLRRFVVLSSSDESEIIRFFQCFYSTLPARRDNEPMLNILCSYERGRWRVIVFPRERKRSSHFYQTGDKRVIVGPATVELGGVLVLPRLKDFLSVDGQIISEIYEEVTLSSGLFEQWLDAAMGSINK